MRPVSRLLLPLLLFLALPSAALAQTGSIRGRVLDTEGATIASVVVALDGTGLRATPDARGNFVITSIVPGNYVVRARRLGYAAEPVRVTVQAGVASEVNIAMRPTAAHLAGVEVLVGSRAQHTAANELAVPVDILTSEEMRATGTTETSAILSQLTPSVNFPRQSVSDATEIVRPFTMRGLGPDHTLVLINGKRRHHTALVHYYGAGMGAGSSGVDMNTIPVSAIDRMEVLRDGAAAQYGSDAIAGVVNVVLKEGVFAPMFTVDAGRHVTADFDDDGTTVDVSGGWGIPLGRGSLSLFAEYRDRDGTNRAGADPEDQITSGDRDDIDEFGNVITKNNPVPQPTYHWGDGGEKSWMTFLNAGIPIGTAGTGFYLFGGYSFREGTGYGYFRHSRDERNWPQQYPFGFLPRFVPDVTDFSVSTGIRGALGEWSYDLGGTLGHSGFVFRLENTLNASLGPCFDAPCAPGPDGILGNADDPGIPNQTEFRAGELRLYEGIATLDAHREFEVGLPSPLSVAFGAAFRRETYEIKAGELGSYVQGFHPDRFGDLAVAGSQVFPGYRPEDEVDAYRNNFGVYLDLESDIAPRLLANIAGRYEHYSDFGSRLTGKLALRYQPSERVTLRTAVSTGFRAPSLNQSYYSSTVTDFKIDQSTGAPVPFEIGIFPVRSAEAQLLGARPLVEETSVNFSGGFALTPTPGLNFTADVYFIALDDRILLSTFLGTDSVASILRNAGSRAEAGQYFTNVLDTETRGVDITGDYEFRAGARGRMNVGVDFNYTRTEVVGDIVEPPELQGTGASLVDEFIEGGILALEKERPRWRAGLTTQYQGGSFSALARASFYGPFTSALYGYVEETAQEYDPKAIFDAEVGYAFTPTFKVSLGGRNLFDTYPDRMIPDNSFGVFLYPSASPFGFNGRFLYTRFEFQLAR